MQIRIILIRFIQCFLILSSLTHCMSYDFSRRVVQQGNLLPESKIARLKTGMTKNDVAMLMGNTLLSPTFNNDRWDYAYTLRRGAHPLEVRHVVLYFTHEKLTRIYR